MATSANNLAKLMASWPKTNDVVPMEISEIPSTCIDKLKSVGEFAKASDPDMLKDIYLAAVEVMRTFDERCGERIDGWVQE